MPTIVIQKGHHAPREPGFERVTGASGEQEVVGVIGDRLAAVLTKDNRFGVRLIPGKVPPDVRSGAFEVDAFISLHCDGSSDTNRKGWGVGYPAGEVNRKLAGLVRDEFARFHPSEFIGFNYTPNMSGYYAYSRIPTPGPEVLIEHGFSSSPEEKAWMLDNAEKLAQAQYQALLRFFALKPPKPPADSWITPEEAMADWEPGEPIWAVLPGPKGKPDWFWQAEKELQRRRAVLNGLDT